jgi:hypothetical protein
MPKYRVWERGVYEAREVGAVNMREAVGRFSGCKVLHLSGPVNLSSKSNTVRWIDSAGTAREFTAYELHDE